MDGLLKIATCQFGVSESIERNADRVKSLVQQACQQGAQIVHLPEMALSGYAGVDFENFEGFDWELLKEKTLEIISLAQKLGVWIVLGSTHRLTPPNKPHNSLYLIGPDGRIHDRYDKRFCTETDLNYYTPGSHFTEFTINGIRCSILICFDLRFPEIYRALYSRNVRCIFQSFYNARQDGPSIHTHIMRQTMQAHAATNYFRISMANSCAWYCPYPSCFIQPDGRIERQLEDHKEGFMINTVDINESFYDPSAPFRDNAIKGILTSGPGDIDDIRSNNTTGI